MPALLDARSLVKHLGGRRVVDGVDLACETSQIVGLLGPNGAGKTTTLRMLYGFLRPDAGQIHVNGVELGRDLVRAKRAIGVCTQDDTFDGDFTVEQNLTIAAGYFRPRPTDLARRVAELLERFDLVSYAREKPETLSGGYRRRLMIARALVHRPRLLFLDEPTTGLDPQARMGVWDLVDGLRAEGLGIILTTHYMDEAERLSDALTVLARGRVVARGTARRCSATWSVSTWWWGRGAGPRGRGLARRARARRAGERAGRLTPAALRRGAGRVRARVPRAALRGARADARRPLPQAVACTMSWLAAALEWQSRAVVGRHLRVYMRNWHTAFLPPAVEPVTMLVAFGVGLGGYVATLTWQGRPIECMTYVAPGLLAYATFMTAIFQSLFAAFIRMRYQRTWEGQLTTQVELTHVVWGEVLWAGLLATMYVVIVSAVLIVIQWAGLLALDLRWLPVLWPITFVAGCGFAALGLCFTAIVPTIDHMNLPVFLLVLPMGCSRRPTFRSSTRCWSRSTRATRSITWPRSSAAS